MDTLRYVNSSRSGSRKARLFDTRRTAAEIVKGSAASWVFFDVEAWRPSRNDLVRLWDGKYLPTVYGSNLSAALASARSGTHEHGVSRILFILGDVPSTYQSVDGGILMRVPPLPEVADRLRDEFRRLLEMGVDVTGIVVDPSGIIKPQLSEWMSSLNDRSLLVVEKLDNAGPQMRDFLRREGWVSPTA